MDPRSIRKVGPYPVVRFIAEGGFAWVFEVVDPRFDARRALKMLKASAAEGDEFLRFQSEILLLARLDHPNLITVFEFGQDAATGCHYYVMSLINGPNLQQMIQERGPVPPDEAGPVFLDALKGLSAMHDANIVHRDIKPSNILVTRDGLGKLGDLGIARVRGESGRTRTNTAVGTELYMSPEQARGQSVGPQSDIFSLGLTLYQVLTGHTVYEEVKGLDSSSGHEVLMYMGSLLHTGKPLAFHFPKQLSRRITRVIQRACELDATHRYADAREMYDALADALDTKEASPGVSLVRVGLAGLGVIVVAGVVYGLLARSAVVTPQLTPPPTTELEGMAPAAATATTELASPPSETSAPPAEATVGPPPGPPRITRVSPRETAVSVARNANVNVTIRATDPNADPLTYAWTFDGKPLSSREPTVSFPASGKGTLTVRVDDGRGGVASESWKVSLLHQAPTLELSPGEVAPLEPGGKVVFQARVSDPDFDGPAPTPRFLLDGRQVAEGASYTFNASEPGTHELEVKVVDPEGAAKTVRRTLVVAAREPPPPPPPAEPRDSPMTAIERYKKALEAHDIVGLRRAWVVPPEVMPRFLGLFRECRRISVEIEGKPPTRQGGQASVEFSQLLACDETRRPRSELRAVLVQRTDGQWQITSLREVR